MKRQRERIRDINIGRDASLAGFVKAVVITGVVKRGIPLVKKRLGETSEREDDSQENDGVIEKTATNNLAHDAA